MSEVTLEAIEELFDAKLEEKLDQKFDEKLAPILKTQAQHTAALSVLMSEKKTKDDNQTVSDRRLDRLENWGQKVGKKTGVKLEL